MPEGTNTERFEIEVDVLPEDIDELGHVNNVVYLRWVQDAAVAHWRARAAPEDQEVLVWVVGRHEIDYKRPAMREDSIVVQTWVGHELRRGFERHTAILRAADRKVLARALTVWHPLNARSGKRAEVSEAVKKTFSVPR